MNRVLVLVAIVIVIAGGIVFMMKRFSPPPQEVVDWTNQSEVRIDIQSFAYSQPNIKIKKGTKVTWTNQDTVKHNAMKGEDSDGTRIALTKDQVKPDVFSGPMLAKGETYSFVFNTVGVDSYYCAPHPRMKGMITVVE